MAHISYKMNTGGKKALSGKKKIKILQWFTAKKIQMEENVIKISIEKYITKRHRQNTLQHFTAIRLKDYGHKYSHL